MSIYWADVSEYQRVPIDDTYPHRVFSFRTNSGSKQDRLGVENARRALDMLNRGRLDVVIPYYFFRPGQANCDLHKQMLSEAGLWGHPKTATMVDVEDADGTITGNVSEEVNDEIRRLQGWYGDPRRVIGYYNPNPAPNLWPQRPPDLKLVVPHYNNKPGDSYDYPGRFGHQYSDRVHCPPFGECDANFTGMSVQELRDMLGIKGGDMSVPKDVQEQLRGPELAGWEQLGGRSLVDAVAVVLTQLIGPNPYTFDGWPQLSNRTLVDAVKQALENQVRIAARLDVLEDQNTRILRVTEGKSYDFR